jgi:hypothetical protein
MAKRREKGDGSMQEEAMQRMDDLFKKDGAN